MIFKIIATLICLLPLAGVKPSCIYLKEVQKNWALKDKLGSVLFILFLIALSMSGVIGIWL